MLHVSTGFKKLILGPHSFTEIFDRGAILVYADGRPATADMSVVGATLLGRITVGGYDWAPPNTVFGLRFEQYGPYIVKHSADQWVLRVLASGTPTWARLVGAAPDGGVLSYDLPRADFDVGVEMILPPSPLVEGTVATIDAFTYSIPPVVA